MFSAVLPIPDIRRGRASGHAKGVCARSMKLLSPLSSPNRNLTLLASTRRRRSRLPDFAPSRSISTTNSGMGRFFALGRQVADVRACLTAIECPRCSRCQTRMMLERVSAGPIGFEQWLFECSKCDHVEISVTASDPFKSEVIGWLAGEFRTPN
jgi:hypothetical protein